MKTIEIRKEVKKYLEEIGAVDASQTGKRGYFVKIKEKNMFFDSSFFEGSLGFWDFDDSEIGKWVDRYTPPITLSKLNEIIKSF